MPEVQPASPFTDTDGAAAYLNLTPRMVRKLRHERRLAAVKFGRLVRYRFVDLDAFAAAHREEAAR